MKRRGRAAWGADGAMEEVAATTAANDRAADAIDRPAALDLVEDLLGGLERETTPALRVALLCRIAEVYERRLADPSSALITLQAAFREQPTSGQVGQEMERLARTFETWREVVTSTAEVAADL